MTLTLLLKLNRSLNMSIPKIRRLSKSKDLTNSMKVDVLSLSVTFVYEFDTYTDRPIGLTTVGGFDVLQNAPCPRSAVKTQMMVFPRKHST